MDHKNDGNQKPKLVCCNHGKQLDVQGECELCGSLRERSLTEPEKKRRMLASILRSARENKCNWRLVENAERQADAFGLTADEIDSALEEKCFRHEAPIIELSEEEKQGVLQLEKTGLTCSRNTLGLFRQGFTITRPKSVAGNSRYSYRDTNSEESDAPIAWVYPSSKGKWYFEIGCFAGAPGAFAPGDFVNEHENLADALADVLDYYFGDESRMNPPELANVEQLRANGKYRGW